MNTQTVERSLDSSESFVRILDSTSARAPASLQQQERGTRDTRSLPIQFSETEPTTGGHRSGCCVGPLRFRLLTPGVRPAVWRAAEPVRFPSARQGTFQRSLLCRRSERVVRPFPPSGRRNVLEPEALSSASLLFLKRAARQYTAGGRPRELALAFSISRRREPRTQARRARTIG